MSRFVASAGRLVRRPGEPDVIVTADDTGAADVAAHAVAQFLTGAIAARSRADWATTGGSTPAGIYRRLTAPDLRTAAPWHDVRLWFGDDRFVPSDHPLSNARPAFEILLARSALAGESGSGMTPADVTSLVGAGVPIPADQVHAFPVADAIGDGVGPDGCAARYATTLRESGIATTDGWPVLDLLLLGIGPDGHLLSVFPGSRTFDADAWAVGVPAPTHVEPHVPRVTLNPRVVAVARQVLVVVQGAAKADVIAQVFGPRLDPRELPAQLARREDAVWVLDEAAAAGLP
jgi:6-phosphogluconolactonase/glucosamine-6-phosphate isomerase/deaminase